MRIISFILFFMFSISVFGQNPKIEKAKKLVEVGKTEKAIALLKKTFSKTADIEAAKTLIDIFSSKKQTDQSLLWADKINLSESMIASDVLKYATLLFEDREYLEALKHCLAYAIKYEGSPEIKSLAYACERLLSAEKNAFKFTIEKLPFNTAFDEISITNYRNKYVMSSNGGSIYSKNSSVNGFDFYLLQQDFNQWRYPEPLLKLSDFKSNKTTLNYSYNGNEVYYTIYPKSSIGKGKKTVEIKPEFKIHYALSLGNEWVEDSILAFQKEEFDYKDPALHPKQNIFVFSSNLNGENHFDLYYCEKTNGKWSSPKNLGSQVNTPFDETMPYFKEDGTLYFSSNNKYGFGGYDIYQTKLDGKIWISPEILPPPINTIYDDLSMTFNYGLPGGYFVSNRIEGAGGYDIYKFAEYKLTLNVNILDDEIGGLLSYAEVQLLRDGVVIDEKLTNDKGVVDFSVGPNINYDLKVSKEGYNSKTKQITTQTKENGAVIYENFRLEKDAKFAKASDDNASLFNNQNFIPFTATFKTKNDIILEYYPIKIINLTLGKIKFLNSDAEGKIEQFLYLGNEYEFEVVYNNETIIKTFSTKGLIEGNPSDVIYIIDEFNNPE